MALLMLCKISMLYKTCYDYGTLPSGAAHRVLSIWLLLWQKFQIPSKRVRFSYSTRSPILDVMAFGSAYSTSLQATIRERTFAAELVKGDFFYFHVAIHVCR